MKKLVRIKLGVSGDDYAKRILGGTKSLAEKIYFSIPHWEFEAVAPEESSLDRLVQFDTGGLCSSSESQLWLLQFCADCLHENKDLTFFANDIYFKPDDPWRNKPSFVTRHVVDESVVFSTPLKTGRIKSVIDVLNSTRSWDIAFFIYQDALLGGNLPEIKPDKILYFFLTAYDRESYIVGRPCSSAA